MTPEERARTVLVTALELIRDLWQFATSEPWGETSEERAASEGDALLALHLRVANLHTDYAKAVHEKGEPYKPAPTWTTALPTVPGWYWWRGGNESETQIVEVKESRGGLVGWMIDCEPHDLSDYLFKGEWLGPIEVPT